MLMEPVNLTEQDGTTSPATSSQCPPALALMPCSFPFPSTMMAIPVITLLPSFAFLFNVHFILESCQANYGSTPQYEFVFDYFGGMDLDHDLAHVSNIIFSNGELDPWRAGGVNTNLTTWDTARTVAIYIAKSAHHLDLRLPDPLDPPSVTFARAVEMSTIKLWISDWWGTTM
jgi:hypothetical protein